MGFLFQLTAVKVLALLGIYFAGAPRPVELTKPAVRVIDCQYLAVSCRLINPLTDDLKNIIESAAKVRVVYTLRLMRVGSPSHAADLDIVHSIERDQASGDYRIETPREVFRVSRLSDDAPLFRLNEARLSSADQLEGGRYTVAVTASLASIVVRATGQQFDLMALWNYEYPRGTSAVLTHNPSPKTGGRVR